MLYLSTPNFLSWTITPNAFKPKELLSTKTRFLSNSAAAVKEIELPHFLNKNGFLWHHPARSSRSSYWRVIFFGSSACYWTFKWLIFSPSTTSHEVRPACVLSGSFFRSWSFLLIGYYVCLQEGALKALRREVEVIYFVIKCQMRGGSCQGWATLQQEVEVMQKLCRIRGQPESITTSCSFLQGRFGNATQSQGIMLFARCRWRRQFSGQQVPQPTSQIDQYK